MRTYAGRVIADWYPTLLRDCLRDGELLAPRGKPNRELRPVMIETQEWGQLHGARVNYRLATAEGLAYLAGWDDVAWLARFQPSITQFSDDGLTFYGSYGKRLFGQIEWAIDRLEADRASRQVVMSIWEQGDLIASSKDLPCNTELHLKIRHGRLSMLVVRRSADLVWGVPYDHHAWWVLLSSMAACLRVGAGPLYEVLDSAHVYTEAANFYDTGRVEKALQAVNGPVTCGWVPSGDIYSIQTLCMAIRAAVEDASVISVRGADICQLHHVAAYLRNKGSK